MKKTQIILTKNQLLALFSVKADKKDPRYYLKGIHIVVDHDKGIHRVEATNAHRLLRIDSVPCPEFYDSVDTIIELNDKPPAKCVTAVYTLECESNVVVTTVQFLDKAGNEIYTVSPKMIDAVYPNTDRVMPWDNDYISVESFGVNPLYLADIAKLLGDKKFPVINMKFTNAKQVVCTFDDTTLVVMQVIV